MEIRTPVFISCTPYRFRFSPCGKLFYCLTIILKGIIVCRFVMGPLVFFPFVTVVAFAASNVLPRYSSNIEELPSSFCLLMKISAPAVNLFQKKLEIFFKNWVRNVVAELTKKFSTLWGKMKAALTSSLPPDLNRNLLLL